MAREFWDTWLNSNDVERLKMLHVLAENIDECNVINNHDLRIHCIASLLKSYLEDLERILKEKVIM